MSVIRCFSCGSRNDAHDGSRPGDQPRPGDADLCWYCGALGVYEDGPLGLRVVEPDEAQLAEFLASPKVAAAREAVLRAREVGGRAVDAVALYRTERDR